MPGDAPERAFGRQRNEALRLKATRSQV